MKFPIAMFFVALLLSATAFAETAVNVKFDNTLGMNSLGVQAKNMTVGESYSFNVRLYNGEGQEVAWEGGSISRCVVTGGIGEANASETACHFYAKKAGRGTLTYVYRAPNFGYDLTATIDINTYEALCTITPKLQTILPLQKMAITAGCSSLDGKTTSCPGLEWNSNGGNFSNLRMTSGYPQAQSADYTSSRYIGKYKIYATDGELSDNDATYCEMSIEVLPGSASKVSIAPKSANLNIGGNVSFAALVKDVNNNSINNSKITWSVNGSIGTVNQSGVFTATQAGNGTIKATAACEFMAAGCPSASVEVVVREAQIAPLPTPPAAPATPPTPQELPPAPPSTPPAAQPPASPPQPQSPATAPQGVDPIHIAIIALVVGVGLAVAIFMRTARKNE